MLPGLRREVNAVDSENDKNLKNDGWRLHHLNKTTSDPAHPYCKFSTGNRKTLMDIPKEKNLDTREALLAFHKKYYSSHIMGVAILVRPTHPSSFPSDLATPLPHPPTHPQPCGQPLPLSPALSLPLSLPPSLSRSLFLKPLPLPPPRARSDTWRQAQRAPLTSAHFSSTAGERVFGHA